MCGVVMSSIKPKLIRVVTDGRVVPWHLEKNIRDLCEYFDIIIVGENVSSFGVSHKSVRYIDVSITPKISFYSDLKGLLQLFFILLIENPSSAAHLDIISPSDTGRIKSVNFL